jgi:hypothetical protein
VVSHIGLDASGEQGWCLSIVDGSDDVNSENDLASQEIGAYNLIGRPMILASPVLPISYIGGLCFLQ